MVIYRQKKPFSEYGIAFYKKSDTSLRSIKRSVPTLSVAEQKKYAPLISIYSTVQK